MQLKNKTEEIKFKEALIELAPLKGKLTKRTNNVKYERIRLRAFNEISEKLDAKN